MDLNHILMVLSGVSIVSVLYSTTASLPCGSAKAYKVCASPLSIDWGKMRLYAKGSSSVLLLH